MTLAEALATLLDLANGGPPTAAQIDARLSGMAEARATLGPNHERPAWARGVHNAAEVYLTLGGGVTGIQVWEDSRGWGAYAELSVTQGTLAEVESLVGPTQPVPRAPDDFHSGDIVAAYVSRADRMVRVFVELARDQPGIRRVTVSFPSPAKAPTPTPARPAQPGPQVAPGAPRLCARCGTSNAGSPSFCLSCGAYLE